MTNLPPMPDEPSHAAVLKAQHFAAKRDWPGYFKAVMGKPPRETLLSALERFERERLIDATAGGKNLPPLAVDLGCGEGRDTLELLRRGWRVHAMDAHPLAFDLLLPRAPSEFRDRLTAQVASFEQAEIPRATLVNASFSLPFCDPLHFKTLWSRLVQAIEPGGRFAGQLFGDRDTWAALPDRSHQTEARARELLADLDIEEFRVEEKDDNDTGGNPKHWHVFHVVARRPSSQ